MIPTKNYHDPAALKAELASVFKDNWQFAAMEAELAHNRDFVCVELPNDSIVVQNFRGELRAFQNVCTHRLNLIQTAPRGNRPLTCAYHGWTFDADGCPLGIGERQGFLDAGEGDGRLRLKRYRVDACGPFIFVSRDPDAPSLEDFLGPFAPVLREVGRHIGRQIHFESVSHVANWKLLVENVLECYHCAAVHPETFVSGLGVGQKPIADIKISNPSAGGAHSSSHFPRVPIEREALRRRIVSHLDQRSLKHDSFFHIHVFPNLFISSTEGTSFYVGHALPLTVDTTSLRVRFFEPAVDLSEAGRLRQDAINAQSVPLGLRVIDEDRTILETLQRGMPRAGQSPVLGNQEARIEAFHRGYLHVMERPRDDEERVTPVAVEGA